MTKKTAQSGQVALISLLILTIATTVGLSLIARSTTDLFVTTNTEESARAFSAAEAGVEQTLKSGIASSGTIDPTIGVSYATTIATVNASAGNPFIFPQKTVSGNTETVWLVNHSGTGAIIETPTYTAGSIDVCWSSESPIPGLVVSVLYKKASDGSYRIAKSAFDPSGARAAVNNFSAPTAATGGCGASTNTTYKSTIQFSNFVPAINPAADILIALRIRPVYNGALIAVLPLQTLPLQGNRIQSVGTTGAVNRKIIVYQQYRSPGPVFDYGIYSEGSFAR